MFNESVLRDLPNGEEVDKVAIPLYQITYIDDSGFGVYVCEDENEEQFNIKGTFISPLTIGQTYYVKGYITTYKSKYGVEKQIDVDNIRNIKPVNEKGVIGYLMTLKGLKTRAYDIYNRYGEKSIDILIENPMEIAKNIKGIGEKSVLKWQDQLEKMKESQATIVTLLEYGLTVKQSKRLYEKYKEEIIKKIEDNPYMLSREVKGFGFLTCDRIARKLGYDAKSPSRIQEGIVYILNEASNSGHCYLPLEELYLNTKDILNIKISVADMNKFKNQFEGEEEFGYFVGEAVYNVNYEDMCKSLEEYSRASNFNKDSKRHVVVEINEEEIEKELSVLEYYKRVVIIDEKIYLKEYYEAELNVAKSVNRIISTEIETKWNIESALDKYCSDNNINLEKKQRQAVFEFAQSTGGFHILNGSAGCGKTFSLKIVLRMLDSLFNQINKSAKMMLMAPTGKASKVATKATGMECVTIHRGLIYNPVSGFEHDKDNPLDADIIIVDESSMLDILLADNLFSAVKDNCKVILLGDTKQLPSVGPGNVLKDLIECEKIKVVTLDVVKRQDNKSGIIENANAIIAGDMIENKADTKDAYIIKRENPINTQETIVESIKRLSTGNGYSIKDIQVLCPQKGGSIGVEYMNYLLQKTFNPGNEENKVLNKRLNIKLNPNSDEISKINLFFKKGDKVIHIKNSYDMPWYEKGYFGYVPMGESRVGITNGECGVIEEIKKDKDEEGNTITVVIVKYDDMYIIYDDGVSELDHSYALTIHKSQGSGFKAVIIPMMMQNYIMLDNNLFYTAYTRAEEFIVVVGQNRAIEHAIKTYKMRERYTTLKECI